jgi:hypothetical protein
VEILSDKELKGASHAVVVLLFDAEQRYWKMLGMIGAFAHGTNGMGSGVFGVKAPHPILR